MKRLIFLSLLAALFILPVKLSSQENELSPFTITVKGLAPILILKTPQQADIIAIINIKGTDNAITVLQNVQAQKAIQQGADSEITLMLSKADTQTLNNLEKTYGSEPKTFLMTIRNNIDSQQYNMQPVSLESLFR